ncbi:MULTISPECIES: hypothetical protein [unclassified Streptomyces]|uniref:hypothetical protein n=1 Tax=unclassified Streptomyces TaxID=2593676 RepID=UPI002252E949|nr:MULTISPECIES: hypothetical protein [unclassified Streptomyces]MCX4406002.1 hypothetical protein [Streptomyces sp. NBC_01764]MCX5189474.1 hypothetical protein [Streptomyces sp. NBC_00268]
MGQVSNDAEGVGASAGGMRDVSGPLSQALRLLQRAAAAAGDPWGHDASVREARAQYEEGHANLLKALAAVGGVGDGSGDRLKTTAQDMVETDESTGKIAADLNH